jgi:hypothetical protein
MRRTSLVRFAIASALCAAAMLLLTASAGAVAVVYNDGGDHTVDTNITPNSIEIRTTTTVHVNAGAVIGATGGSSISTFDSAMLELNGGTLNDELFLFGNSSGVVNGGTIADDITTNDNASVIVNNVVNNDDLEARGSSNMTLNGGSHDEDIESFETATVNIHGGMFQTGTDGANVEAAGSSVVNIFGGNFGTGDTDGAGYIGAIENSTINIYGGNISGQPEGLLASDNGKINVYGFAGGQPAGIRASAGGTISFFDGPLQNLTTHGDGVVKLLGSDGSLNNIAALDTTEVRVFGSSFFAFGGAVPLSPGPIPFAAGNLTGVLKDGTVITNVPFTRNFTGGAQIVLVPEPGTCFLTVIALAGLVAVRRRVGRQA